MLLSSTVLTAVAFSATFVAAFPLAQMEKIMAAAADLEKRGSIKDPKARRALSEINKRGFLTKDALGDIPTSLSELLQTLDLPSPQPIGLPQVPDDDHPFIAPGPTDIRGLCPTLNTMGELSFYFVSTFERTADEETFAANHGYIGRDGVTTFAEAANACQIAFGFAFDICTGLAALGLLAGGDIVSGKMTIAGPDSRVPNTLGQNQGIAVHGPFEIDGSITRADTYFGNNIAYQPDRFDAWYALANETSDGMFDTDTMSANQLASYNISKSTNPAANLGIKYFAVSYAERVFIPAALPNGTNQGVADFANIAPFFQDSKFPKNWFRRDNAYTAMQVGEDILAMYAKAPVALGANEGMGNFVSLENADIPTSSPQALMCFFVTELFDALPGSLAAEVAANQALYNMFVNTVFSPIFGPGSEFDCDLGALYLPLCSQGDSADSALWKSGIYGNGTLRA
ncbi:unspecific peroxygenase, partial [Phenoliferia sp. Uapishka_3]